MMKIQTFKLQNFMGIDEFNLSLEPHLMVIAPVKVSLNENGFSGKILSLFAAQLPSIHSGIPVST